MVNIRPLRSLSTLELLTNIIMTWVALIDELWAMVKIGPYGSFRCVEANHAESVTVLCHVSSSYTKELSIGTQHP